MRYVSGDCLNGDSACGRGSGACGRGGGDGDAARE